MSWKGLNLRRIYKGNKPKDSKFSFSFLISMFFSYVFSFFFNLFLFFFSKFSFLIFF